MTKKRNRRSFAPPSSNNRDDASNSKQRKKKKLPQQKAEAPLVAISALGSPINSKSAATTGVEYPLPFLHSSERPLPSNTFLRCVDPYKPSFQAALDTSYLGFEIDSSALAVTADESKPGNKKEQKATSKEGSGATQYFNHELIEEALLTMDKHGLFRTDVTQPFGLGTKCAKTYVTRCLLGEEGTTYKYLGLRMFAHPWNVKKARNDAGESGQSSQSSSMTLDDALNQISNLNDSLTRRTAHHLKQLDAKRKQALSLNDAKANNSTIKGRAKFDVALINRMIDTKELKKEPMVGDGRCSVSWHADSSLEHYSSIAVYHTIMDESYVNQRKSHEDDNHDANQGSNNDAHADRWSIALRVAHDSEGPGSSNRGTNIESSVVSKTPPIAISLPSQSAYYLLDDFNHHHQHAVLVNDRNDEEKNNHNKPAANAGVRYASTHRLLREGHNVYFVLNRCRNACSQFHKKGPKIWRSEQLLLTEIESEWIRQFFIQGEGHKTNLWKYWREPICELLKYWSRLEQRTKQVIDILKNAARERCRCKNNNEGGDNDVAYSRKERDKMKKSLIAIEEILSRGKTHKSNPKDDAVSCIYEPISELIDARAKMRQLWDQREKDGLFKSMKTEYRPIIVPFNFNVKVSGNQTPSKEDLKEFGESPLPGSDKDLKKMSLNIMKLGTAFQSQNLYDLPDKDPKTDDNNQQIMQPSKPINIQQITQPSKPKPTPMDPFEHNKGIDWGGWGKFQFGLEVQDPWAGFIINGKKTIETRLYTLPKALLGKRILILESKRGKTRVSGLPNSIIGKEVDECIKIIGWAMFDRVITYRYRSKFEADEKKHLVTKESDYAWKQDTDVVYGWVVSKKGKFTEQRSPPTIESLTRRMRSLFQYK